MAYAPYEHSTLPFRADLMKAGFTVTAEQTGAGYPNHAPALGLGWQFVLRRNGGEPRTFADYRIAWAFAGRINSQVTP
jgi:hypothetical protein